MRSDVWYGHLAKLRNECDHVTGFRLLMSSTTCSQADSTGKTCNTITAENFTNDSRNTQLRDGDFLSAIGANESRLVAQSHERREQTQLRKLANSRDRLAVERRALHARYFNRTPAVESDSLRQDVGISVKVSSNIIDRIAKLLDFPAFRQPNKEAHRRQTGRTPRRNPTPRLASTSGSSPRWRR